MPYNLPDLDMRFLLDPHVAAAIARAERRREMLERLSDLGMQLAQDIAGRAAQAPRPSAEDGHPEPRHEPGRAFAAVSRAVRFTLALEAKIDREIHALMRGDAASAAESPEQAAWTPPPPPNASERRRGLISACVWDAIDEEMTDPQVADDLCFAVQERLVEGETYDELLFRPFRASVEAICRDLGLHPDWSRWDDEVGFPPETRRTDHDFTSIWVRWPSGAKLRRDYNAQTRERDPERPPPRPNRRE
jgi:hypothetical protein